MNISWLWLKELVPGLESSPQQVADRLAMLGAPVDEVIDIGAPLHDIVIARVVDVQQHPNADRLRLCTVDAGSGHTLQVVCGAPNVTAGASYPFAPVGASLPGGVTIRRAKIRGEESQGMLCSARELGLGRDHDGLLDLYGDWDPGSSFVESLELADARLVVDITPNRPDLLSHVGVAREIAAAEGLTMRLPALTGAGELPEVRTEPRAGGISVRVEAPDLCAHYLGVAIRGVMIGPSPDWLSTRLRAIGVRPISNVVDATNWVLHELGHPMHAFDLDRLAGGGVVVRRARAGERITTLDGVDRALTLDMLVIADAEKPVAIAGVMGGADSEVTEDTTNILLECAVFDSASVRATRRALGLSTDASYRFERGVDPLGIMPAAVRVADLIVEVASGTVDTDGAFVTRGVPALTPLPLRLARVAQVLGVRFDADTIRDHLQPLGFEVDSADAETLHVTPPGHRRFDISREEDLIEEIARRHGYDAFPDELRPFRPGTVPTHPLFVLEDRLRSVLVGRGLMEAHTAAFAPADAGTVELMLPLAATESRLRGSLLPGLLRRVEYNFARGARSIRLFEIGTVFAPADGSAGDGAAALPRESTRLAIVLTGLRRPPHWTEPETPFDVWDLKGVAADVAALLGLTLVEHAPVEPTQHELIDGALSFSLIHGDNQAVHGTAGRVRAARVDAPAWSDDVWALEVELMPDGATSRDSLRYRELPQQPAVERDLALLLPHSLPAAAVTDAIHAAGGALLEHAEPFDVYSGKGVPSDMRSVAWRLRFRASDRTLTDAEVDAVVKRILQRLNDDLGIHQRT